MTDSTENQIQEHREPEEPKMAETDQQQQPQQAQPINTRHVSFSIWPPTERTRGAVKARLVETLSTPSILSKRYGTVSPEEAADTAARIEAEAYAAAGGAAEGGDGGDGIEILQVYSKEISKRMLDAVKSRSDGNGNGNGAPPSPAVTAGEEAGEGEGQA